VNQLRDIDQGPAESRRCVAGSDSEAPGEHYRTDRLGQRTQIPHRCHPPLDAAPAGVPLRAVQVPATLDRAGETEQLQQMPGPLYRPAGTAQLASHSVVRGGYVPSCAAVRGRGIHLCHVQGRADADGV